MQNHHRHQFLQLIFLRRRDVRTYLASCMTFILFSIRGFTLSWLLLRTSFSLLIFIRASAHERETTSTSQWRKQKIEPRSTSKSTENQLRDTRDGEKRKMERIDWENERWRWSRDGEKQEWFRERSRRRERHIKLRSNKRVPRMRSLPNPNNPI